eukprot:scaffold9445_cov59-Phaeocystis_antarctica.AAC.4
MGCGHNRRLPILSCGPDEGNRLVCCLDWKGKLANETFAGSARNGTTITRKRPRALWHRCKLLAVLRALQLSYSSYGATADHEAYGPKRANTASSSFLPVSRRTTASALRRS